MASEVEYLRSCRQAARAGPRSIILHRLLIFTLCTLTERFYFLIRVRAHVPLISLALYLNDTSGYRVLVRAWVNGQTGHLSRSLLFG